MEPVGREAQAFLASSLGQGLRSDPNLWFRLTDLKGRYLFVSDNVEATLGFAPEEYMSLTGFDMMHPDDVEMARAVMAALADGPVSAIYRMKHKNGAYVWVHTHVQRVGGMFLAIGREVPASMRGMSWQHVDPFT